MRESDLVVASPRLDQKPSRWEARRKRGPEPATPSLSASAGGWTPLPVSRPLVGGRLRCVVQVGPTRLLRDLRVPSAAATAAIVSLAYTWPTQVTDPTGRTLPCTRRPYLSRPPPLGRNVKPQVPDPNPEPPSRGSDARRPSRRPEPTRTAPPPRGQFTATVTRPSLNFSSSLPALSAHPEGSLARADFDFRTRLSPQLGGRSPGRKRSGP